MQFTAVVFALFAGTVAAQGSSVCFDDFDCFANGGKCVKSGAGITGTCGGSSSGGSSSGGFGIPSGGSGFSIPSGSGGAGGFGIPSGSGGAGGFGIPSGGDSGFSIPSFGRREAEAEAQE